MGQKWKLLLTLIGVGISSLLSIIYPLLLAQAINLIAQEVQLPVQTSNAFTIGIHSMNTLLLLLVGIFSARALFSYLQQYVLASVAENVTLSMRKRISEKLNRVPLRFYDTHKKEIYPVVSLATLKKFRQPYKMEFLNCFLHL